MRHRLRPLLTVSVLGAACLLSPLMVPAALALPSDCARPDDLGEPPRDGDGTADTLVNEAATLAESGELDEAERLYELALSLDEPDPTGATGLAYVEDARRAADDIVAAAEQAESDEDRRDCFAEALTIDADDDAATEGLEEPAPDPTTGAQRATKAWDRFVTGWLSPAAELLLPALVLFGLLLLVVRLLTRMTGTDTVAWPRGAQLAARVAGLALLVAATVRATTHVQFPDWKPLGLSPGALRWPLLTLLVAATAVVAAITRWGAMRRGWSEVLLAVALVALAGAFLPEVSDDWWPWALSLSAAVLGAVLLAAGRGHALRVQVRVVRDGAADGAGTALVLGALQELGSAPPRGLKFPQQVDVEDLPLTALDALPSSKVTAVLKSVAQLLVPAPPWRALVEDAEGDRLLVTLTRNGAVAGTVAIDPDPFRRRTPRAVTKEPETDGTRDGGLIAAAAVVLTELSRRHLALRAGLCGATRWDSVAALVVATRPGAGDGPEVGELLALAVERDPGNALARAAYIGRVGRTSSTPGQLRALAGRLNELWEDLPGPGAPGAAGYGALRLRTAHSLTAVWLNVAAAERLLGDDRDGRESAEIWYRELVRLLDDPTCRADTNVLFTRAMDTVAIALRMALEALGAGRPLPDPEAPPGGRPQAPTLQAVYDRACERAMSGDPAGALDLLAFVAPYPAYREAALRDPWFTSLRPVDGQRPTDEQQAFRALVGPVEESYVAVADLGSRQQALLDLGVAAADDMVAVTGSWGARASLAATLGVPTSVIDLWRSRALLEQKRAAATAGAPVAGAGGTGGG